MERSNVLVHEEKFRDGVCHCVPQVVWRTAESVVNSQIERSEAKGDLKGVEIWRLVAEALSELPEFPDRYIGLGVLCQAPASSIDEILLVFLRTTGSDKLDSPGGSVRIALALAHVVARLDSLHANKMKRPGKDRGPSLISAR